jgi:adenylate cyclase
VVVAIDDTSLLEVGRWPWDRNIHADLISKIAQSGARVIAYDVNFPEASKLDQDAALAEAIRNAKNVVLPVELQLETRSSKLVWTSLLAPISDLASVAASLGHSNTPPDEDGVVRRVPLVVPQDQTGSLIPAFAAEALRVAGVSDGFANAPKDQNNRVLVHVPGTPFKSFRMVRAVDVLKGRMDMTQFQNAIVFVGSTAADLHDALLVPTSGGVPMPGVEIHASFADTALSKSWLRPTPPLVTAGAVILLAILVTLAVIATRARYSWLIVLGLWIGSIIAAFVGFDRGWVPDLVWPTLVLAFTYGAVTVERRVTSDRERRELKTAFSRYVSGSVVDAILRDPTKLKLGGERRRMSVLFSDIRGFTSISEKMSPEELVENLNIYLNRMTDIVFANTGVLDKYIGDAVMAFWNAPFDQKDHALRAIHTALEMSKALSEMNAEIAFGELELHIGIGINTGDMVVGNVGGDARFDYTVIGDNVNLGSRLEGLTKEYGIEIIAAHSVVEELNGEVLTRRIDKVAVKGKKEPVIIHEVMGLISNSSDDRKKLATDFEAAFDKYLAKDFMGAVTACDAILSTHPEDGPTKTLMSRAEHFRTEAPPADWVGTWVYTKK